VPPFRFNFFSIYLLVLGFIEAKLTLTCNRKPMKLKTVILCNSTLHIYTETFQPLSTVLKYVSICITDTWTWRRIRSRNVNSRSVISRWCSDWAIKFPSRQWSLVQVSKFPHNEPTLCSTPAYCSSCFEITSLHKKAYLCLIHQNAKLSVWKLIDHQCHPENSV